LLKRALSHYHRAGILLEVNIKEGASDNTARRLWRWK